MEEENINQNTLRDEIANGLMAIDENNNSSEIPQSSDSKNSDFNRDDKGRFSTKTPESDHQTEDDSPIDNVPRPKGWKKDHLPLWEKMYRGETMSPDEARQVALYANQRETEYANGVSTYKAEAETAKKWNSVIEPMLPRLQQSGIDAVDYMKDLVAADNLLTNGTPDQKIQALSQIANAYGVPLSVIAGTMSNDGQTNPVVNDLLGKIEGLNRQISQVEFWKNEKEKSELQSIISQFQNSGKAPHFEAVRPMMSQLLDTGVATSLEDAYAKAVRLNDEIWETERQKMQSNTSNASAVQKAKAASVSVKSSAPSGNTSGNNVDPNDLRSLIASGLESQKY